MSFFRLLSVAGPAVCVVLAGCGANNQALERRLTELETQLTHAQNENDRLAERVGSLELERAARPPQPTSSDEPTVLERPPLKVVRMDPSQARAATEEADAERQKPASAGPDSEAPSAEAPPDPKRPVLRLRGNKGGVRQGSRQPPQS